MKKLCFAAILTIFGLISCSSPEQKYYSRLDHAIEHSAMYDHNYTHRKDSLMALYNTAVSDSAKWEAAYGLERILSYHNIDSCHLFIRKMLSLHGMDQRQKFISEACYAYILYKMDSIKTAQRIFEQIDTSYVPDSALKIYCDAGYHIYSELLLARPEFSQKKEAIINY